MRPDLSRRHLLATLAGLPLATGAFAAAPTGFLSRRIAVRTVGTGRDVLLIPGLGTGPDIWAGLVHALPGCRWHLIHVRGFAGLAPDANGSGPLLAPLAREIARYIDVTVLQRPAIIGHSMGGSLAMMTALAPGARTGPLMVVDMLPAPAAFLGGTGEGIGFLADQLRGYFTQTIAGRRAFAALLRDAAPDAPPSDPDVIAVALDEMARLDLRPQLPRLAAPLTIVPAAPAKADTRAAILALFRTAYRAAPRGMLRPIGPSGHMVMLDQPSAFVQEVRTMLAIK